MSQIGALRRMMSRRVVLLTTLVAGCFGPNPGYIPCSQQPPAGGGSGLLRPEVPVSGAGLVKPFSLDVYEVTVAAYRECLAKGGCTQPAVRDYCNWTAQPMDKEDHPINCVDEQQAAAFCQWAGRRLPTDQEWSYAAGGPQTQTSMYPWGGDSTGLASKACWSHYSFSDAGVRTLLGTCRVGSFANMYTLSGSQVCPGAADLAGNVWEWTSSEQGDMSGGTSYYIRGGGWDVTSSYYIQSSASAAWDGGTRHFAVGFRCARDAP